MHDDDVARILCYKKLGTLNWTSNFISSIHQNWLQISVRPCNAWMAQNVALSSYVFCCQNSRKASFWLAGCQKYSIKKKCVCCTNNFGSCIGDRSWLKLFCIKIDNCDCHLNTKRLVAKCLPRFCTYPRGSWQVTIVLITFNISTSNFNSINIIIINSVAWVCPKSLRRRYRG